MVWEVLFLANLAQVEVHANEASVPRANYRVSPALAAGEALVNDVTLFREELVEHEGDARLAFFFYYLHEEVKLVTALVICVYLMLLF